MFSSKSFLPPPTPGPSSPVGFRPRRRRLLWAAVLITIIGLVFLTPNGFWDLGEGHELSGGSKPVDIVEEPKNPHKHDDAQLPNTSDSMKTPDDEDNSATDPVQYYADEELHLLLHMVSTSRLTIPSKSDPSKPLARDVYDPLGTIPPWSASGQGAGNEQGGEGVSVAWLKPFEEDPPIVVFSKTYCPYSKQAKDLFEKYDITPAPKIVEVDLRSDSDLLKALLTRLTGRGTFPNILVRGKSLGGWDELSAAHDAGELRRTFEEAKVTVQGDVKR